MTFLIPREAEFLTVEFAKAGDEGVHKQRVTVCWAMRQSGVTKVIEAAVNGCKRNGVAVANVLRVTHKQAVLFDAVADLGRRLR